MPLPIHPGRFEITQAPGYLIRRAHQLAVAQFSFNCAKYDLTSVQFGALTIIAQQEGIDQVGLSQKLALDAVTVGSVLQRLEMKQLIARTLDASDKRRKCLHTTSKAQTLLKQITPLAIGTQSEILSPLSQAESIKLIKLMDKLVKGHESKNKTR
jgi:DNA-binding MarR family transcriptional regulator